MSVFYENDKVERVDPHKMIKVPVNIPVSLMVDIDHYRGKYISRPSFIKIAIEFMIADMKKSKKNIIDYSHY